MRKSVILFYCILGFLCFNEQLIAQDFVMISISGIHSGNETNDAIFKATAKNEPELAYIRAQRIQGPQDGLFTHSGDNIRYYAISNSNGIPANLSKIRFSFLKADKKTAIILKDIRFIINDIDGPNNEALATNCNNVHYIGTANPTNLIIDNTPPDLNAVGSVNEEEGPTSRVMFEFRNVTFVEFDNYADDGYLKDFDLNNDYPISEPVYVECADTISEKLIEFKHDGKKVTIETNPIYFDMDKWDIRKDAEIELEKVIAIMKKYPEIKIELGSYTDSRAEDNYNLELSNKRAKSTVNWIIAKGINASRITGNGYGETKLVNECSNSVKCTEKQHQLNRRTEFVIVNPEVIK